MVVRGRRDGHRPQVVPVVLRHHAATGPQCRPLAGPTGGGRKRRARQVQRPQRKGVRVDMPGGLSDSSTRDGRADHGTGGQGRAPRVDVQRRAAVKRHRRGRAHHYPRLSRPRQCFVQHAHGAATGLGDGHPSSGGERGAGNGVGPQFVRVTLHKRVGGFEGHGGDTGRQSDPPFVVQGVVQRATGAAALVHRGGGGGRRDYLGRVEGDGRDCLRGATRAGQVGRGSDAPLGFAGVLGKVHVPAEAPRDGGVGAIRAVVDRGEEEGVDGGRGEEEKEEEEGVEVEHGGRGRRCWALLEWMWKWGGDDEGTGSSLARMLGVANATWVVLVVAGVKIKN